MQLTFYMAQQEFADNKILLLFLFSDSNVFFYRLDLKSAPLHIKKKNKDQIDKML